MKIPFEVCPMLISLMPFQLDEVEAVRLRQKPHKRRLRSSRPQYTHTVSPLGDLPNADACHVEARLDGGEFQRNLDARVLEVSTRIRRLQVAGQQLASKRHLQRTRPTYMRSTSSYN